MLKGALKCRRKSLCLFSIVERKLDALQIKAINIHGLQINGRFYASDVEVAYRRL